MTGKQSIILLIGAAVIAIGAYILFSMEAPSNTGAAVGGSDDVGAEVSVSPEEADAIITRTANGYESAEVTISKGDIVLWQNRSEEHHWPASDVHPTHEIYAAFDPLRPIASGEDWAFRFERVGEWKFHDHLRSSLTGTVTVTE